jgi:hypothetical protein
MMDRSPIKTAGRENRCRERIGGCMPVCVMCGYTNAFSMSGVTMEWLTERGVPPSLLQLHHVDGRAHDPELVVPLCPNCHREVTEGLYQSGVSMRAAPSLNIRQASRLEALAVFFEHLVPAVRRWAEELRNEGETDE